MRYTVTNVYGIRGESTHRTVRAAVREARRREGEGWIVVDKDGNRCGLDQYGEPEIIEYARQS